MAIRLLDTARRGPHAANEALNHRTARASALNYLHI
jgi:hypothetical protein